MDTELIFWIILAVVGVVAFIALNILGAREERNYLDWMVKENER